MNCMRIRTTNQRQEFFCENNEFLEDIILDENMMLSEIHEIDDNLQYWLFWSADAELQFNSFDTHSGVPRGDIIVVAMNEVDDIIDLDTNLFFNYYLQTEDLVDTLLTDDLFFDAESDFYDFSSGFIVDE